jgi:hypothetical protein
VARRPAGSWQCARRFVQPRPCPVPAPPTQTCLRARAVSAAPQGDWVAWLISRALLGLARSYRSLPRYALLRRAAAWLVNKAAGALPTTSGISRPAQGLLCLSARTQRLLGLGGAAGPP